LKEHAPVDASSEEHGDMNQVLRVAWYRFWATFGRRWPGYLAIVLLIGLIGGTAMASIAAARRTQASFATFLASTNPSDLSVNDGVTAVKIHPALAGLRRIGTISSTTRRRNGSHSKRGAKAPLPPH
jgi:hypothetical protein